MNFSRLRLSGFKSFVDPIELVITGGLTGVVGPNGCGKSNLLEALRWVMGENSPKKMRGGEMDDVIFAGTELRPGRNVAEVVLTLDNADRSAPAAYNDNPDIQVSRRIERSSGSVYRVNGNEVRARDVQLLFADIASGNRSSALVSQGQISDLIRAKPAGRRHLLEEAAGISGLQSRRHEAELRLRAAETNMERLADVIQGLETQLANLQRQARQAARYRRLSERIKEAEGRWLYRRWRDTQDFVAAAQVELEQAEAAVAEMTGRTAAATTAREAAAERMPGLREAENEAGAALHELEVARVALDAEERRLNEQQREIEERLGQLVHDLERERALAEDARQALARLEAEKTELEAAREGEAERLAEAAAEVEDARGKVRALEQQVTTLTGERASRQARRQAAERQIADLTQRLERLTRQASGIDTERDQLNLGLDGTDSLDRLRREEAEAERQLAEARAALETAEQARADARRDEDDARNALQQAQAALTRLEAERDALSALLAARPDTPDPIIDKVRVAHGFETALAAALGDDLDVPAGADSAAGWLRLDPYPAPPALPDGAEPLSRHVEGPPELRRRLDQIGVIDEGRGAALAGDLKPGQRLVTRDGALWRWDGYHAAGAASSASARLEQRNRLDALADEITRATDQAEGCATQHQAATGKASDAATSEESARQAVSTHSDEFAAARDARRDVEGQRQAAEARRADLAKTAERIAHDRAEVAEGLETAKATLAGIPVADDGEELEQLSNNLERERGVLAEYQEEHDRLRRDATFRETRLSTIAADHQSWSDRADGAERRIADLATRRDRAAVEKKDLEARPEQFAEQRKSLVERLEAAENVRRQAADARAAGENDLSDADKALRETEAGLADTREERARREGAVQQGRQAESDITRQVQERLETKPEPLGETIKDRDNLPDADDLEQRFAKVVRERDNMGPVNLRAEIEAADVEEQLAVMLSEKDDLEEAIARLRRGIQELNREGRERLVAAFNEIDGHFQALHKRLFGGHARLSLVDSDDPLEAGLEIEASPSGKKLQILSLLSGGEQALTALALIFALFQTNPSPVCVLDEVDAPLDDANVDRFCDLLDEFASQGTTRFLIITHHRLTMARMDRLFGVTMSEPGVSQLVSVDLSAAEAIRATG